MKSSSSIISHLLPTDDYYIFSVANSKEIDYIQDSLQWFNEASSQIIILDKSKLIFSANTARAFKIII